MASTTTPTATDPAGEDYTSSEGLRALLHRLHDAGPGAWEHDPVAAELMMSRRRSTRRWRASTAWTRGRQPAPRSM